MLWVKRQPCLMRGVWGCCSGPVEADHAGRRGVGRKAHDSTCIPLCRYHHGASRFPRAWTQAQRRAWLHAAVVYTQACARAACVEVPIDPAPVTEYPAAPVERARVVLADAEISASFKATPGDHLHPRIVALVGLANSEISKIITAGTLTSDAGGPGSFALGRGAAGRFPTSPTPHDATRRSHAPGPR
jgi:hypothetical protein